MNKQEVIEKLQKELKYDDEKCININKIIEETFLIGRKNKQKMIDRFIEEVNVNDDEANKIYETFMDIISKGLKEKLKHPFKDLDK